MKKRVFYTEPAYIIGQLLLALGTALITRGGLGISMVVAPAYILHMKLVTVLPWFSFGVAEYVLQATVLLIMMLVLRKIKLVWFLSIVSAVLYGLVLDGAMWLVSRIPVSGLISPIPVYGAGVILCTAGISLLFCSYLPPAAYELLVKEVAQRTKKPVYKMKTLYDCCSLAVALIMSLVLFGDIRGVGPGTVFCALVYGFLIQGFTKLFDRLWQYQDKFPLRNHFEENEE